MVNESLLTNWWRVESAEMISAMLEITNNDQFELISRAGLNVIEFAQDTGTTYDAQFEGVTDWVSLKCVHSPERHRFTRLDDGYVCWRIWMQDLRPIFILCHARSGSTLLRYCLDSHRSIACPPETNLASTLSSIYDTVLSIPQTSKESGLEIAREACLTFADSVLGDYVRRSGKDRWCDKSLVSVNFTRLLEEVFPDAQFICIFRNSLDFIMSALEASPWGFGSYGLTPYVQSSPQNTVAACAQHWLEKTTILQEFIEMHPTNSLGIRYEDLTLMPAQTLASIYGFLNCEFDIENFNPHEVFREEHDNGPGDYKIESATSFATESIGRGWKVPIGMIPAWVAGEIDGLHSKLGYPLLGDLFDEDSTHIELYSRASPIADSLIERLKQNSSRSPMISWSFGIGKLIVLDVGSGVYMDFVGSEIRPINPTSDSARKFDYTIVTDAASLSLILSGKLGLSSAVIQGVFSVRPSATVASADHRQLYVQLSELFTVRD